MKQFLLKEKFPVYGWTKDVPVDEKALAQISNMAKMPFIHKHIAIMPDVHWGMGATVGSVIPTVGAIIPAAVGVDIGCFTGDTEVILADSKSYRLDELAKSSEEFIVYSFCTESQKIVAAKATAQKTRIQAELIEVELDNGEKIRCTPDHKFMLRNGLYCEAQNLTPRQSLMPFYSKIDYEGYFKIKQISNKSYERAHWIIANSGFLGDIPIYPRYKTIIHHKNFIESDNTPDNLQFMSSSEHASYHRKITERNTHWQSPEFEAKRKLGISTKAKTPEGYEYYAARGTANIKKYMEERPEHFKQSVASNGKRGAPILTAYNTSEKGRAKSKEIGNRMLQCPDCEMTIKSYLGLRSHRKHKHQNNHRVAKVTMLQQREDVYCLSVPKYHNFALSAGVFVHNCGMIALQTTLKASDLPDNLFEIRSLIEEAIPHGRSDDVSVNDIGSHKEYKVLPNELMPRLSTIVEKHPKLAKAQERAAHHLGTLGTGNHFIELCLDENQAVWIMLHSGSRGIGNKIGTYFIEKAKKEMQRWFINLPDIDLAYIPEGSVLFDDYMEALDWAQEFAMENRKAMMTAVLQILNAYFKRSMYDENNPMAINCHHNYVSREKHFGKNVWLTRKGAVSAREGQLGIIPGSMGAKSFIVRGKGNHESFCSCSHGAGRVMSRGQAIKEISLEQHAQDTMGVECKKDISVIDESPKAYKDIEAVMSSQDELVEIVHTLKQILCVKG